MTPKGVCGEDFYEPGESGSSDGILPSYPLFGGSPDARFALEEISGSICWRCGATRHGVGGCAAHVSDCAPRSAEALHIGTFDGYQNRVGKMTEYAFFVPLIDLEEAERLEKLVPPGVVTHIVDSRVSFVLACDRGTVEIIERMMSAGLQALADGRVVEEPWVGYGADSLVFLLKEWLEQALPMPSEDVDPQ